MVIMIIFIFLSVVFSIGIAIYLKRKKQENNQSFTRKRDKSEKKRLKKSKKTLKDILDIKIKDSIICANNRYSCIVKLGCIDYNILSDNEQETIENVLMQTAISLEGPVQFFTTTEKIDTTKIIEKIRNTNPINAQIANYKKYLINFLYQLMNDKNISLVRNYAIISYDGLYKDAAQVLNRRILSFKSSLLRAKIQCEILNEDEIYDLLYRELNKNSDITKINNNEEGERLYVTKKEKNKERV